MSESKSLPLFCVGEIVNVTKDLRREFGSGVEIIRSRYFTKEMSEDGTEGWGYSLTGSAKGEWVKEIGLIKRPQSRANNFDSFMFSLKTGV